VLRVRLAIVHLDVDPTRRYDALVEREPDAVEIRRLPERAESVQSLATLIVKVDPRARCFRVAAARRKRRRRGKHIVRKFLLVQYIETITCDLLAVDFNILRAEKIEDRVRQHWSRRRATRCENKNECSYREDCLS